jgi:hypothetical protein
MTRVLIFDGPRAGKRFELLWAALQSAGDGKGERIPATIRKEARLQDALEQVSQASNGGDPMLMRTLVGTPTVAMAQEDFDLLVQYTEKTPWTPRVSRDVVDVYDFLSTAEKRD